MNTSQKYRVLAEILRSRINALPSGSKLPSMRSLKQRLGYSMQTIIAAVNLLEREGLLTRRHGSGLYVNRSSAAKHVAFCRTSFPGVSHQVAENYLRAACERRGWTLGVYEFMLSNPDQLLEHEIRADGAVLMPDLANYDFGIVKVFKGAKMPMVVIGGLPQVGLGLDYVDGDNVRALVRVVEGLIKLGHRHIAYLVTEPRTFGIEMRVRTYIELCAKFNLGEPHIIDSEVPAGQDSGPLAYAAISRYLKAPKTRPQFTALICLSSPGGYTAMRALHDHGVRVPEDCSVVGMFTDALAPYFVPSLSSLAYNHANQAEQCVALIEGRLNGTITGGPQDILIPHKVMWRESVGAPPAEKPAADDVKAPRQEQKRSRRKKE